MPFLRSKKSVVQAEVLSLHLTERGRKQTARRDSEHEILIRILPGGQQLTHTCNVPWDRIPRVGQRLPVELCGDRVTICWDDVPSLVDASRAAAAAALRGDNDAAANALGFKLRE